MTNLIIRGRMPLALVFAIRFGDLAEGSKATSALFGTTNGKVYDIVKGSNFTYITKDTKFSAAQISEGIEFIKQHPDYDAVDGDKVVNYLSSLDEATAEELEVFDEARKAARGRTVAAKNEVEDEVEDEVHHKSGRSK